MTTTASIATTRPQRIQRRRTRGWQAPLDDQGRPPVYVGRPTRWGNPHHRSPGEDPGVVIAAYAYDLATGRLPVSLADVRRELAGRNLSCWCRPDRPCHADVLLAVANAPPEAGRSQADP